MPDAAKKVQRPQQRKLEERPKVQFQDPKGRPQEEESSEDDSDDEEEDSQHDSNQEARHDARCFKCNGRDPVWVLHLQPQRAGADSGQHVHVPVDSNMAGYNPSGGN